MNYKSLTTLEYNKIIEKLVSFAASEPAKERLKKLVPMTDINDINHALAQTNDALRRIYAKGCVDFSGIKDIRASVKRLEVGSALSASELLNISSLLTCATHVKGYYEEMPDSISDMFTMLDGITSLNNSIKRAIISEDEISDEASPTLKSLRRQTGCRQRSNYHQPNRN